jgi:hypothetical protein
MDWLTLMFWTGDIFASLSTGFVELGEVQMEPKAVVINYLKTWFALDVIVVGPDWAFTILELTSDEASSSASSSGNLPKMLRTLRVMRTLRILRLAKMRRALDLLRDRIDSEAVFIAFSVMKLIFMILLINHILGAAWHALGLVFQERNEPNWLDSNNMDKQTLLYSYLTSLHWSLTQFTPAAMEVQPVNSAERCFAVVVLVAGLILFSSFVSSITASTTRLRSMHSETSKQMWLLRRYLRRQEVSEGLKWRALRHAEHALSRIQQQGPAAGEIWVLAHLSQQLGSELKMATRFVGVQKHPLLAHIQSGWPSAMDSLLHSDGLSQASLAREELVFEEDSVAICMRFVLSGVVQYQKDVTTGSESHGMESLSSSGRCQQGIWMSEPALWTSWLHVGSAHTTTECEVASLSADEFAKAVLKESILGSQVQEYAIRFLAWLNCLQAEQYTDVYHDDDVKDTVKGFLEGALENLLRSDLDP